MQSEPKLSNPLEVQRPPLSALEPVPNELTYQRLTELGKAVECAAPFDDMEVRADELCVLVNMALRLLASSFTPQGVEAPWSYDMDAAPEDEKLWIALNDIEGREVLAGIAWDYEDGRVFESMNGLHLPAYAWMPYEAPTPPPLPAPPVTLDTEEKG